MGAFGRERVIRGEGDQVIRGLGDKGQGIRGIRRSGERGGRGKVRKEADGSRSAERRRND